ncbi:lamin tail domain-containing protein [Kutzneria kofuensis]|uniref:LTD domain-containing protein n=1 Tax=Kutzneria kofuensis TaxID=103725 RepID=A0A7W9KCC1_9PSEU|nr:lamin tail domain-containing protein [Kutzneria kofuensis]MBB5889917.1 hypothetical protein [Kutzneria kofuensis]
MRRSVIAFVAAGIVALSLITDAAASAAARSMASVQKSSTFVFDQIATHGPAGAADQYIQIKNLSQVPQDLGNFKVEFAPSRSQIFEVAAIPPGTILQPGQVYLMVNPLGYSGPTVDEYFTGFTLPERFSIALLSPSNVIVDSVSTIPTSPIPFGDPAPICKGPNAALIRRSNTGDNAVDFYCGPRVPGLPGPDA